MRAYPKASSVLVAMAYIPTLLSQTRVPACPAGSHEASFKNTDAPYTHHQCKLPQRSGQMQMCRQWDESKWTEIGAVPCGSRVSAAIEYTGTLKCPIAEQIISCK